VKRFIARKISLPVIFLLVLGLSGCGWWKEIGEWWRPSDMARATPEGLYKRGAEQYQEARYKKAVESFQRLREQFPLHVLAPDAELGIADSYFSDGSYVEAELTYRDFINLRPNHQNVPYAMYQLGMSHYREMGEMDRDQTDAVKAVKEFERLIARFPGSKFSFLAEQRALECRKRLADREFYVGNFYFTQGKYKAALGRFETIAKDYPGIGLDYKVQYFIEESKKRLIKQEAEEKATKEQEEQKARSKEEKAAAKTTVPAVATPAVKAPNVEAPAAAAPQVIEPVKQADPAFEKTSDGFMKADKDGFIKPSTPPR
jgi:outer membrane protein assembly factor BamD